MQYNRCSALPRQIAAIYVVAAGSYVLIDVRICLLEPCRTLPGCWHVAPPFDFHVTGIVDTLPIYVSCFSSQSTTRVNCI